MNWDRFEAHTSSVAKRMDKFLEELVKESYKETPWEFDLIVDEFPPRISIKFFLHSNDGRREEVISELGITIKNPTVEELGIVGDIMGKLEEKYSYQIFHCKGTVEHGVRIFTVHLKRDTFQ